MLGKVFIPPLPIVPAAPFQPWWWIIMKPLNFGKIYIPTLSHRGKIKAEMPIIPKLDEEGEGQKMQKGWTPCQLEEADERPGREGS